MKPLWFETINIEDLPEPFRSVMEEAAQEILPLVRDSALAKQAALSCIKTLWGAFEGTDTYWHRFEGDKFCRPRHAAIRADFHKQKQSGTFDLRRFLNKWKVSERNLRTITKATSPRMNGSNGQKEKAL